MTSIPWNRINTGLLLLVLLAIVGLFATRAYGGPLDPPGPPSSTLPQVEPRMPIDHLPFTISQSGSYFATKNLTGDGTNDGITITASNVTIDLNGFTLSGVGKTHVGIHTTLPLSAISIAHGVIANWDEGVRLSSSEGGSIRDIEASTNNNGMYAASRSVISDCVVRANDRAGLEVFLSRVTGCVIAGNGVSGLNADSAMIERNLIQNNGTTDIAGFGVALYSQSTLTGNVIENNGQTANVRLLLQGNTVSDNDMYNPTALDVIDQVSDNVVIRNRVTTCTSIVYPAGTYVPIAKLSGSASSAVGLVNTNIALNPSGAGLC